MREAEAQRKREEEEAMKRLQAQQAEQRRLLEEQRKAEERRKAQEAERKKREDELQKKEREARQRREEARRAREEEERANSVDGGESVDQAQQAREALEEAKREEELRQKRRKALLEKQRKIRERKRQRERKLREQRESQQQEQANETGGGGSGGGDLVSRHKDEEELFKEIEAESRRTGKKWTDTSFTGAKALYMNASKPKTYGVRKWRRPEEFLKQPTFGTPKALAEGKTAFTEEEAKLEGAAGKDNSEVFTADAIQQGMLGDCWFLSAMGIIADNPSFMKPLFVMREITASGAYVVRFHKGGKIRKVIVDDMMPCDAEGQMAFVHSDIQDNRQEIWMMVSPRFILPSTGA